jgi:hypothetical protein
VPTAGAGVASFMLDKELGKSEVERVMRYHQGS